MTKQELLNEINRVKAQIKNKKGELTELEKDLAALEDFSAKCNTKINSFSNSIARRRNKLSGIDSLTGTVRSAMRYKTKMNDMLTGAEYKSAVAQIDYLQNSVNTQKNNTKKNIISHKDDINYLTKRLQQLQYDYNHFPEEVTENG